MVEKLMLKYNGLAELVRRNEGEVDYLIQTARRKTREIQRTSGIGKKKRGRSGLPHTNSKKENKDKRAGRNHECRLPGPNENRPVRSKRHGRGVQSNGPGPNENRPVRSKRHGRGVQSNGRSYKEFKRAPHGNDQHGNRRWFKSGVHQENL
ncbi:hypothetical protein QE152_g3739 [Popillia japonica]|uniref:Uncharacterized protein n=1 Tax=Popillia japonica TaxID=7064 RepID=A0AAW1N2X4_POPJA